MDKRQPTAPDQPAATPAARSRASNGRSAGGQRGATRALRAALAPYLDLRTLRQLAAHGEDLHAALIGDVVPEEIEALLSVVAELLRPAERDQVRSPDDAAAFLMARMGPLDQEEVWALLLNTRNYVIAIHRISQGSRNSAIIRVGEVFREAIRRNAASVIVAHNHPTGLVDPSPEDVLMTQELVAAGKLLDCTVLDHLILGQGRWLSLRRQGLGFGDAADVQSDGNAANPT